MPQGLHRVYLGRCQSCGFLAIQYTCELEHPRHSCEHILTMPILDVTWQITRTHLYIFLRAVSIHGILLPRFLFPHTARSVRRLPTHSVRGQVLIDHLHLAFANEPTRSPPILWSTSTRITTSEQEQYRKQTNENLPRFERFIIHCKEYARHNVRGSDLAYQRMSKLALACSRCRDGLGML